MTRPTILRLSVICALLALMVNAAAAQQTESGCDIEQLIAHENEHAQELTDFQALAETDLDTALGMLYRTAIAYQALAVGCGFTNTLAVEATHDAEHAGSEGHDHSVASDRLELARSVGDPEQGQILFNTLRIEVSFACATCHRVDTTERLVGPGLLGIGDPAHDPTAHAEVATEEAGEHDAHHQASAEETPEPTIEATIDYVRTSIMDPSAFIVPGFPDNLMPKVYGEVLTDDEINNLVAYLLTL